MVKKKKLSKKMWNSFKKVWISERDIREAKASDSFVIPLGSALILIICICMDWYLFIGKNAFFSYVTYYNTKASAEAIVEDYGDEVKKVYYYNYRGKHYQCDVVSESSSLDKYVYFNKKNPANCVERRIYEGPINIFSITCLIIGFLAVLFFLLMFHVVTVHLLILSFYVISTRCFKKN